MRLKHPADCWTEISINDLWRNKLLTVLLYGHLGKAFGRKHRFEIRTPVEAVRALSANYKGFRAHLAKHSKPGYRVLVGKEPRDLETLAYPADDVIRIVPVVAGAGKGIGSIIAGIALIGIGIATGGAGLTMAAAWEAGTAATVGYFATGIGASLLLGGVAQMLTPTPKSPKMAEKPQNLPSFVFDGAVNTTTQNNPVSLCYGRMIAGSQVISAGMSVNPA